MKRRILSMILALCMLLAMAPVMALGASAEELDEEYIVHEPIAKPLDGDGSTVVASGYCGGEGDGSNLTWTLTDDGTLTISGEGKMKDYSTVPWADYKSSMTRLVIENGVTSIGRNAFNNCSSFTGDLVIPDSVTSIGYCAFYYCSRFTGDLIIPDSVTSIGRAAFGNCSGFNGKLVLSNSVTNIGESAFQSCRNLTGELIIPKSLTSVEDYAFSMCSGLSGELLIPDSITSIGNCAFQSCSGFTGTLTISDNVTEIGESSFSGTSGITWIEVESTNPNYASKDGILYDIDYSTVIQAPGGLSGELNLPDSVTIIGSYAFRECSKLNGNLVIPDGVASIGNAAFYNCSGFTGELVIPGSVTSIEDCAFTDCTGLSGNVYFKGNAPEVVDASQIYSCSFPTTFTLYYIPGTTGWTDSSYYDASAGTWNGYKLLTWDGGNTDEPSFPISGYCGGEGDGTNLTWTLTEDGTLTISGTGKMADYDWDSAPWAGYKDSLKTLVINSGVTSIGSYAFHNCSGFAGDLVIPEGVTSIGGSAFGSCYGFKGDLVIPKGVTSIGGYAFYNCSGFNGKLVIPEGVTSIGGGAFNSCYSFIGELVIPDSVTSIGDSAFSNCSGFTGDLVIPDSVTAIGDYAFGYCDGFTGSLVIGKSVTTIGNYAFGGCSGFGGDLVIPKGVTSIASYAFYNCNGFNGELVLPDGVTSIGDAAFSSCSGFTGELVIPDSVTSIGDSAFSSCMGFTGEVVIPSSVTKIGEAAFSECYSISQIVVDIANKNYASKDGVLYDKGFTKAIMAPAGISGELILPDSVTSIGNCAFEYCSGLTGDLIIPNSVTSIGNCAFEYCSGLTGDLIIPNSVTSIGDSAFSCCGGFTGDLIIPNSVTSIGSYAFEYCRGLTGDLIIPNSVTSIGDSAFSCCGGFTGDLIIPNSVTSIGDSAFSCCGGFTGDLIIPNSVTSIGNYAFLCCSGFTGDLVIPSSVGVIEGNAFYGCTGLSGSVYFEGNAPLVSGVSDGYSSFPANFTLYYVPGTSGWTDSDAYDADAGTWNGYKLATWDGGGAEVEDEYFTVTFDLNGGDGTAPAAQRVLKGGYATEPEDPKRSGYTFMGWSANKECTGVTWFNSATNRKGKPIQSNITLYARWIDSSGIVYGIDTFSFINTDDDFFKNDDEDRNYEITGDYYDVFLKGRSSIDNKRILDYMYSEWGGSCFGMSAILSLVKAGSLDTEYFHSAANCLYDLPYPRASSVVFNLINYYHLMQFTDRTVAARICDMYDETPNNRAVIDALNESSYPVVVGFNILNDAGVRIAGHAVVAYDYEETDDGYNLKIWDPNDKFTPNTLFISKDFGTSYFERTYDSGGWTSYIQYALTVESGDYDYRNIQQELQNRGHSSGADAVALTEDETTSMLLLDTNYASFTIKASDGTEAVMENGTKISGDLEISDGMCLNEMGAELSLEFSITPNGDVEYTIVPSESVSVVTDEALEEYSTVLYYSDDVDGFYAGITAADTGILTFGMDGSLSSEFETETYQAVSLADNDAVTPWMAANFEATTMGLTVASDGEKVSVSSLTDAEITANVEDIYNSVGFAAASATADAELTLFEDTSEAGKIIFAGQEQDMGCALIFYSLGGTTIEAQTNIPVGTAAEEPEDPVREGFIFAGWYASPDYEEESKWDFATPLEEDTRIYAKWQQDENYLHTVTFRAEGNDDIIVVLRDGESLSEDQMPAVPEKEGCTGRWEDVDLSNVTSDIVVNAIYTSAGLLGDVNGDGNITATDARWILQCLSGARQLTEEQMALADVNGDGSVTATDARWILQYLSGARDEKFQAK